LDISDGGASSGPTVTVALGKCLRGLQQSLDHELDALSRAVTPNAVHRSRTAARRLRAVLRAFKRELNPVALRRYTTALRELAHDLDEMRDADVTQQAFSSLSQKQYSPTKKDFDRLKAHVEQNRHRLVRNLQAAMAVDAWAARILELRYVASDPSLIVKSESSMTTAMHRVVKHRRQRLRAALCHRGHAARTLHKLRLKIKTMRYLIEQCVTTGRHDLRAELMQLRSLQECLGELHDAWCLRRLLKDQWRYRRTAAELSVSLKARQKELIHRFRKHRKRLRRIWDAAL
jgi:CHAD domain-containing protein